MNLRQRKRLQQETQLAWGDKKPDVKPPTKPDKIKYLSDKKGK